MYKYKRYIETDKTKRDRMNKTLGKIYIKVGSLRENNSLNNVNFLAVSEGIGDTLDVKNDRNTGDDPLLRRSLGLKLCVEHISGTSGLSLVDWALINVLFFSSVCGDRERLAKNDRHD